MINFVFVVLFGLVLALMMAGEIGGPPENFYVVLAIVLFCGALGIFLLVRRVRVIDERAAFRIYERGMAFEKNGQVEESLPFSDVASLRARVLVHQRSGNRHLTLVVVGKNGRRLQLVQSMFDNVDERLLPLLEAQTGLQATSL